MNGMTSGTLYIVSTPIGNLEDISYRAIRLLKEVVWIAAEDTRKTRILLNHYGIQSRMESYHDYNKESKAPVLIKYLLSGDSVAVVTDAGTPGISDPAYRLIQYAIAEKINIVPIPGPTAAITAISVSGLPTDRFVFEGFLPVKKGRSRRIESMKSEQRTIILYESPHRLLRTLKDLLAVLGEREVAICRELTKKFEEIIRTTLCEAVQYFNNRKIQGEFVLVIHGNKEK
jgi:16S rRNA (cytidine1402-2'-O)-methyltransferase